jgi:hypothetical protein
MMGTRADFYVDRGVDAEWIWSICYDGYPSGIADDVLRSTSEQEYRSAVSAFLKADDSATTPDKGWPWPWNDSGTTDYAYAFETGKVWASGFGHAWFDPLKDEPEDEPTAKVPFPDMSSRKNVTFGPRSGLTIILGGKVQTDLP